MSTIDILAGIQTIMLDFQTKQKQMETQIKELQEQLARSNEMTEAMKQSALLHEKATNEQKTKNDELQATLVALREEAERYKKEREQIISNPDEFKKKLEKEKFEQLWGKIPSFPFSWVSRDDVGWYIYNTKQGRYFQRLCSKNTKTAFIRVGTKFLESFNDIDVFTVKQPFHCVKQPMKIFRNGCDKIMITDLENTNVYACFGKERLDLETLELLLEQCTIATDDSQKPTEN